MEFNVNNSFFTGKFLIHLAAVDSTNNFAKQHMAKSSPIDGTVILADEQFAGRGQAGTSWTSDANTNLTFSLIYHTSFLRATEQFYLNMAVSIGLVQAIDALLNERNSISAEDGHARMSVKVKWPNDIYVNEKKIAGVLIENSISGMQLKYSVIGIGLNVNQTEFPEGLNAVGMKRPGGDELDRNLVLNEMLSSIEKYFLLLKERKFELLKNKYLENLYRFREEASYSRGGELFRASIADVEDSGKLILQTEKGREHFGFKEIVFIGSGPS